MLKRNLSVTMPVFTTRDLDLAGLNPIPAHQISFSILRRIHLHHGADSVVTDRSSINDLIGGWRVTDLTSMFIAKANKVTEMVVEDGAIFISWV